MMVDVQQPFFFTTPTSDYNKLRMSASNAGNSNWFDGDIASFLNVNEDVLEFPQSVPTSSPITEGYYSTSSPETYCGDSPYSSDVSQTPSPFDPSLFQDNNPPQPELYLMQVTFTFLYTRLIKYS